MGVGSIFVTIVFCCIFMHITCYHLEDTVHTVEQDFKDEVDELIHHTDHDLSSDLDLSRKCECKGHVCSCCFHWEVDEIHLNTTVCVNVTYLDTEYGLELTIEVNQKLILNYTISAKNPPPICFKLPYLKRYASLCLRFYDMSYADRHLHFCMKAQARLYRIVFEDFELGCYTLPPTARSDDITKFGHRYTKIACRKFNTKTGHRNIYSHADLDHAKGDDIVRNGHAKIDDVAKYVKLGKEFMKNRNKDGMNKFLYSEIGDIRGKDNKVKEMIGG